MTVSEPFETTGRNRPSSVTALYAASHFVVDLSCIATLLGVVAPELGTTSLTAKALAIMAYDMVAFCMQMPIGALLDVVGRRRSRAATLISLLLTAAGVVAPRLSQLTGLAPIPLFCDAASVALLALGNALFHCVGGVEVLGESDGRASLSGMFISTGALGVFLGSMEAFNGWANVMYLLLGLLAGAMACTWLLGRTSEDAGLLELHLSGMGWVAVMLLAATVALRSYTGMVMAFPWKVGLVWGACAVTAVFLGKAAGGLVADAIGTAFASAISLGGAAVLFWYSWDSVPAGLAGTFLFNFTMAITLSSLARLLPQARGLAFGIASFSLAVGALPALLGLRVVSAQALVVLSAASLVLLELGLLCSWLELRRNGAR